MDCLTLKMEESTSPKRRLQLTSRHEVDTLIILDTLHLRHNDGHLNPVQGHNRCNSDSHMKHVALSGLTVWMKRREFNFKAAINAR